MALLSRKRDLVYLLYFIIHIPVLSCMLSCHILVSSILTATP